MPHPNEKQPSICIVITTRNRQEELRVALKSCLAQDYPNLEVRVFDDASDDGTASMVREEFPKVILHREEERKGLIALRSCGYRETKASWVVSIDDDAYFTDQTTISTLVHCINKSDAAALALPFLEPFPIGRTVHSMSAKPEQQLRSFVGTAHACRVASFHEVGGYLDFLVHQGEERDLCIRMVSAGLRIILADTPPLVHAVSPKRDIGRMHRWGTRNLVLFDFFYTPATLLIPVIMRHAWKAMVYRFSIKRAATTFCWLVSAIPDMWRFRKYRKPIAVSTYRSYMNLPSHGPDFLDPQDLPGPCCHGESDSSHRPKND